jgi:23S rRNA (adenine2503-C2)-methyltransferase
LLQRISANGLLLRRIICYNAAMNKDLKNMKLEEIEELVLRLGGKKYLAKYIFSFIHTKDATEIDDISTLSKELRHVLSQDGYYISNLKLIEKFVDPDGTIKFLFELADGHRIESVLMTSGDRRTLCISCQAGCRMGCVFCATAKLKFRRNLTAGEIVDQVNKATIECGKINNVVYMGMGEPMDNYEEVVRSLYILNHHAGKYIGQRHITISTCGIVEGIREFSEEKLQVHLSISLHATTDDKRAEIMSVTNKCSLDDLIEAVSAYQCKTRRRVMFVYCMIAGVNDSAQDVKRIIRLLDGLNVNVNLLEYNPHPGCDFKPSSRNTIHMFMDTLMQAGIETTVRYTRGQEIKAACGQLGADWLETKN